MSATPFEPPPRAAGARYYAWLYTPANARDGAAALLSIEHEIMAGIRPGLDHSVAHSRLGWWQEETERLNASMPQHPAALAARNGFLAAGLPSPDLRALPELAARELARRTLGRGPATADEASAEAILWAEGLFRPFARLAAQGAGVDASAIALGRALHAHEHALADPTRSALDSVLRALPVSLTPALCSGIVWASLALRLPNTRATRREALAENWAAWRAARRALRGRT